MKPSENAKRYWSKNIQLLTVLLIIWFTVSFGFGILFVDILDKIKVGGVQTGLLVCSTGNHLYLCPAYIRLLLVYE